MSAMRSLDIGGVKTTTNLILSPMSGVTDSAFRRLVRLASGDAVGLLVSEFIAAEGLTRDNQKTLAMLAFRQSERPLSIQIFGADEDRMVRAAVMVEEAGADIVDINCGCPAPKVVRRGGGAEMMRQPERLGRILGGIKRAVSIPMTVKIRAGWDDSNLNAMEIARLAEGQGASMLAVHGRTRRALYSGKADWDLVEEIRRNLSIPVIGSGDVVCPRTALSRLAAADGLMIGRAAIDNPWIFAQARALAEGRSFTPPSAVERVEAFGAFIGFLREALPDKAFMGRLRGLACRFIKGLPDSARVRRAVGGSASVEEVEDLLSEALLGPVAKLGAVA